MRYIKLRELLQYKYFLWNLVKRDLTVRYKRSVLGFFWTLLHPIANTIVCTIIFSTFFHASIKDFVIYFYSGFQLWNFFAQSTTVSSKVFLTNSALIKRIYVPKDTFVLGGVISNLINFGLTILPLLVFAVVFGISITPAWLFLPVAILFMVAFTIGVSLILGVASVFFHDIIEMYQLMLMPWFYLTPIIYRIDIIPKGYRVFLKMNPMYHLVECFRMPIFMGQLPKFNNIFWGGSVALATLLVGYLVYAKFEDSLIYNV